MAGFLRERAAKIPQRFGRVRRKMLRLARRWDWLYRGGPRYREEVDTRELERFLWVLVAIAFGYVATVIWAGR